MKPLEILSRSEAYQQHLAGYLPNQKNNTLVRQYFGDLRLETAEHIAAGNQLYEQMWLYYNLFQPVMHLSEKIMDGDTVRRKWDEAKTPYQRLLETGMLSSEQHTRLRTLYEHTNPLQLRQDIYAALAALWDDVLPQSVSVA